MKLLERVRDLLHWSISSTVGSGKHTQNLTGYEKSVLLRMASRSSKVSLNDETSAVIPKQSNSTGRTDVTRKRMVKNSEHNK